MYAESLTPATAEILRLRMQLWDAREFCQVAYEFEHGLASHADFREQVDIWGQSEGLDTPEQEWDGT